MSAPMRDHVALTPPGAPIGPGNVAPATFERLRAMVAVHGWTPMVSEADGRYRAWIRHTNGGRIFGRPAGTAQEATELLITKVEPWAGAAPRRRAS